MRTKIFLFVVILAGILSAAPPLWGQGLDPQNETAVVAANKAFCEFPITVECRVKLENVNAYNVVIANQTKASGAHWELFTTPGDGNFSVYIPGFTPDHVRSGVNIVDGQFHHLAAVFDKTTVALYIDGNEVTETAVQYSGKARNDTGLTIGRVVEGGIGCHGIIEVIRISKGRKPITISDPTTPDADTLALWRFTEIKDGVCADLSGHQNDAVVIEPVAQGIVEGKNITAPFLPLPELPDVAPFRKVTCELTAKLNLRTIMPDTVRDAVWQEWKYDFDNWDKIEYADRRAIWFDNRAKVPVQVYDINSLIWPEDGGPAGTAIRRTEALLNHLAERTGNDYSGLTADLRLLKKAYQAENLAQDDSRQLPYYMACCLVRRQIVLSNPLLDFDEILCLVRGTYAGSVRSNPHTLDMQGGHFVNQYFGFNALPGGGVYVVKNWKGENTPEVCNLLENSVVQNGRLKGKKLDRGAFCTPDLDFDGRRISFSWSGNHDHQLSFSRERLWHIFTINADGSNLTQLTDEAFDDFDSCWLPNGRIAFISERRGGYIRCFSGLVVPQYSLFSMKDDGSDMFPLSYYETSEWSPTVNNDGKIVYTRWDYTDRENCLGSRFWICGPDGTNPRVPHGNYPNPWHTFSDQIDMSDSRMGAPRTETSIRAIPHSSLYLMTAAPHHGDIDGTLCLLDLSVPDDGHMSQILRITPEELFPESEMGMRSHFKYKTPWPLSEDFYLVNSWENLVLVDRFGNKELICGLREMPCPHDDRFRVFEPIPLRPRQRPPVIPSQTTQGEDTFDDDEKPKATIAVMNVYESDQPMPAGVKIKWLRVVQNILKRNPEMGDPMIGYERENTPRIPLGIVPVEEDGSAYFEAPVAKELIFQILDENYMAVQSMRSVAFVHPGEQLSCIGCHEDPYNVPSYTTLQMPLAMQRLPSQLQPEIGPIEPVSYYRQIKPIFDNECVDCHRQEDKGPVDMSYEALREKYTFWFAGGMLGSVNTDYSGVHGGTRSIPGRFGARYCLIGQALLDDAHKERVSEESRRKINLWLDCNSLRLTAFHRIGEQLHGKLVWPYLDVDPRNPLGVEGTFPELEKHFWHQNMEGPHPFLCSSHQENKVFIFDKQGQKRWEFPCANPQDVWMLDNGHVLVATLHAVREIKPDLSSGHGGAIVWEYKTEPPNEIPTCLPLPDGNVLIGIVGECRLIEVNRQGKILFELKLETTEKTPHAQFRLCRKTPEGTYLVPFTAEGAVREYSADGKVIREFPRRSTPVGAIRLPDGNTLISADGRVTEYNPTGGIVWELAPRDIPDIQVAVLAGIQRFPNGNTIICNWGTQPNGTKAGAHIFEVSHDKRVTWQVESTDFGRSASCQILSEELLPSDQLIWR